MTWTYEQAKEAALDRNPLLAPVTVDLILAAARVKQMCEALEHSRRVLWEEDGELLVLRPRIVGGGEGER